MKRLSLKLPLVLIATNKMNPITSNPTYNFVIGKIEELCSKNNIDESHGVLHAITVATHAWKALIELNLDEPTINNVILASLLHDVDDHKYYDTVDYANARAILQALADTCSGDTTCNTKFNIEEIISMIDLVSYSQNQNQNTDNIPKYKLIPQKCDRIEAMGTPGVERCIEYSKHKGNPMHTQDTPLATNTLELRAIMLTNPVYNGKSASVIDHCYEKLLKLREKTGNKYIDSEMKMRHVDTVLFVINYCASVKSG